METQTKLEAFDSHAAQFAAGGEHETQAALECAREALEAIGCNAELAVRSPDHIVLSAAHPSEDWELRVTHYYRSDNGRGHGSLIAEFRPAGYKRTYTTFLIATSEQPPSGRIDGRAILQGVRSRIVQVCSPDPEYLGRIEQTTEPDALEILASIEGQRLFRGGPVANVPRGSTHRRSGRVPGVPRPGVLGS
ncbi:MAG: hypothetical protein IH945_02085 [Armatimonadetes bacterium]|nr:hypothetical protein [Armatimonadota bacterium]